MYIYIYIYIYVYKYFKIKKLFNKMEDNINEATLLEGVSWDDELNRRFWLKFNENKYIRKIIYHNKNLTNDHHRINHAEFELCNATANLHLSSQVSSLPFKEILWEKKNDYDNEDDYIIGENFRSYYKSLVKILLAMKSLSGNIRMLLLCNIFDLCNVVAFDLEQDFVVILYDCVIYIIFYADDNQYIKLNMAERLTKKHNIHYTFQNELRQFISEFDKSIIDYYSDDIKVNCSVWGSLLNKLNSPLTLPITGDSWSNWDLPVDHLHWRVNKKGKTYSREYVHFRFNLRDIYNFYHEGKRDVKSYSLQTVCDHLFYFNHLYINHEALIYNNVIHIDFEKFFFCCFKCY